MTYQPRYRIQGQTDWINYGSPITATTTVVSVPGNANYEFQVVALDNNLQYPSQILSAFISPGIVSANTILALSSDVKMSDWAYGRSSINFTASGLSSNAAKATNTIETMVSVVSMIQQDRVSATNTIETITSVVSMGMQDLLSARTTILALSSNVKLSDWSYGLSSINWSAIGAISNAATAVNTIFSLSTASAVQRDIASATNTLIPVQSSVLTSDNPNLVRNAIMNGLDVSSNTMPADWNTDFGSPAITGITWTLIGTGTVSGLPYIDIRAQGTASGTGSLGLYFESDTISPGTAIVPDYNTFYWGSFYAALISGSLTNISAVNPKLEVGRTDGGLNQTLWGSPAITLTSSFTRFNGGGITNTSGFTNPGLQLYISFSVAGAGAVNFTVRVGGPQIEKGTTATAWQPTGSLWSSDFSLPLSGATLSSWQLVWSPWTTDFSQVFG